MIICLYYFKYIKELYYEIYQYYYIKNTRFSFAIVQCRHLVDKRNQLVVFFFSKSANKDVKMALVLPKLPVLLCCHLLQVSLL